MDMEHRSSQQQRRRRTRPGVVIERRFNDRDGLESAKTSGRRRRSRDTVAALPSSTMMPLLLLLLFLAAATAPAEAWVSRTSSSSSSPAEPVLNRRGAIERFASLAAAGGIAAATAWENPSVAAAAAAEEPSSSTFSRRSSSAAATTFEAYCLTPEEDCVRSKLDKIEGREFLGQLATPRAGGSVWLGDHCGSVSDRSFQAMAIREVHRERRKRDDLRRTPMAVGLEAVQSRFQPVLDDYVAGRISLSEAKRSIELGDNARRRGSGRSSTSSSWSSFDGDEILTTARDLGIRLLALNVDSEDLAAVERMGYTGLPTQKLSKYITDPEGFADYAKAREFETYADHVIKPSFALHQRLGLTTYTAAAEEDLTVAAAVESELTFGGFLSGRHLRDEGMASVAYEWCADHPGGLLVGLVGADHVKYEHGVPGRFARMAAAASPRGGGVGDREGGGGGLECTAVVINPTLNDSRPSSIASGSVSSERDPERVTLQLRYPKKSNDGGNRRRSGASGGGEGVLSFSDYVVVT